MAYMDPIGKYLKQETLKMAYYIVGKCIYMIYADVTGNLNQKDPMIYI